MTLFLRESERLKRLDRAAFVGDVFAAAAGVMGDGDAVRSRIDALLAA